jgi:hypothetical protein
MPYFKPKSLFFVKPSLNTLSIRVQEGSTLYPFDKFALGPGIKRIENNRMNRQLHPTINGGPLIEAIKKTLAYRDKKTNISG